MRQKATELPQVDHKWELGIRIFRLSLQNDSQLDLQLFKSLIPLSDLSRGTRSLVFEDQELVHCPRAGMDHISDHLNEDVGADILDSV